MPIPLCIDGRRFVAGLQLDLNERMRRLDAGLGAVTSTALLHALWELPYGFAFPSYSFKSMDRDALARADDALVEKQGNDFVRLYQPVGTIRSITVQDKSLARAVAKAGSHPPTVRRTAVWRTSTTGDSPLAAATLIRAKILGVGVIALSDSRVVELVKPADALRSQPAVFRWWQAELAYRNWVSCREPSESTAA
jgi:hypothetical protein